jgi:phosphatidylglycerophosphate synthase
MGKESWFFKNLANFVTGSGLISTLWFIVVGIVYPEMLWLLLLLGIAIGLSDFFDGKIARYLDIKTPLGVTLDRIRDKIFVCSALVILFWKYWPKDDTSIMASLTETLVIAVVILEISIFLTMIYGFCKAIDLTAARNGKVKMFGEFFAIAFWLISLTIDKYCAQNSFGYMIYIIDLVILISVCFGFRGFTAYYQTYTKK